MIDKRIIELNAQEKEQLKAAQLELLQKFKEICEKYNLTFYLYGGTLLGAVRHKGFIPWDDDIDVCMPREDYDKFCEIFKEDDFYFLQNRQTDKYYPYHFSKFLKKNTIYNEYMTCDIPTKKNIFIDVFPINKIPDKGLFSKFHYYFWLFIFNRHSYSFKFHYAKKAKHDFKYKLLVVLSWLLLWWCPFNLAAKFRDNFMRKHQYKESILCISGTNFRNKYRTNYFEGKQEVDFENYKMPIMDHPELYLKEMYGDYMALPPVEKRICHHFLIEFKA